MGKTVPTSLLTAIRLTSTVSGVTACASTSGEMRPSPSGFTYTTSAPRFSSSFMGFKTLGCSMAVVTTRRPRFLRASYAPKIAKLFASVPPEVNVISARETPKTAATLSRASSSARDAAKPSACRLEGFPNVWVIASSAASTASLHGFVVEELSR